MLAAEYGAANAPQFQNKSGSVANLIVAQRAAAEGIEIGTFSLRMAEFAAVSAFDIDERALSALAKAASPLRPLTVARREGAGAKDLPVKGEEVIAMDQGRSGMGSYHTSTAPRGDRQNLRVSSMP
jgi:hypothetical protein